MERHRVQPHNIMFKINRKTCRNIVEHHTRRRSRLYRPTLHDNETHTRYIELYQCTWKAKLYTIHLCQAHHVLGSDRHPAEIAVKSCRRGSVHAFYLVVKVAPNSHSQHIALYHALCLLLFLLGWSYFEVYPDGGAACKRGLLDRRPDPHRAPRTLLEQNRSSAQMCLKSSLSPTHPCQAFEVAVHPPPGYGNHQPVSAVSSLDSLGSPSVVGGTGDSSLFVSAPKTGFATADVLLLAIEAAVVEGIDC